MASDSFSFFKKATQLCLTLLIRSVAATRSFRITFHHLPPPCPHSIYRSDMCWCRRSRCWLNADYVCVFVSLCVCARTTGKKVVCPANFVFLYFCRAVLKYDAISGAIKLQGLKRHNTHLHTLTHVVSRNRLYVLTLVELAEVYFALQAK